MTEADTAALRNLATSMRALAAVLKPNPPFAADVALARKIATQALDQLDRRSDATPAYLVELIDLCTQAGIRIVQSTQDETAGLWDWVRDADHEGSDQSFATRAEAALNALDARFGEEWSFEVDHENPSISLVDWIREVGLRT
ncbi:MAG: hypothetical protein A2580_11725 [Hydrogenophilales bacterium RIFOXYD1_FULL_62_11]|nr:MAG: hypothetical protein A2580_11725 [Hydrogenophilales bacterium RIFOXYD1_FULL_62_11]